MTNPEEMPSVTFRPTRGQRRLLAFAAIIIGLAIPALLFGLSGLAEITTGGAPLGGYTADLLWGVIVVPLAIWLLDLRAGRTTIDANGITVWRPLWRRSCRWQEVTAIAWPESARGNSRSIKVRRKHGLAISLPAPTSAGGKDPVFLQQLETIRRYWDTVTSQALDPG
jgi:hypothetical protein